MKLGYSYKFEAIQPTTNKQLLIRLENDPILGCDSASRPCYLSIHRWKAIPFHKVGRAENGCKEQEENARKEQVMKIHKRKKKHVRFQSKCVHNNTVKVVWSQVQRTFTITDFRAFLNSMKNLIHGCIGELYDTHHAMTTTAPMPAALFSLLSFLKTNLFKHDTDGRSQCHLNCFYAHNLIVCLLLFIRITLIKYRRMLWINNNQMK